MSQSTPNIFPARLCHTSPILLSHLTNVQREYIVLVANRSDPLLTETSFGPIPTIPIQSSIPASSGLSGATITRPTGITGLITTTQSNFADGSTIVTVETLGAASPPPSGGGLSPPSIAGAVVGAVGGTAAILLLLVFCVRYRRHVKDKRKSMGAESIKALHVGPSPMMAHNSARYTNMFPNGGAVRSSSPGSARVAFLPASAAGFLNRASGSPLQGMSRAGSPDNSPGGLHAPVPPSPSIPAHFKSGGSGHTGEVAFLAADASNWLNRSDNGNPVPQPGPSGTQVPFAAAAIPTSNSRNNSPTQSLPSLAIPASETGNVSFLPGAASVYLNHQPSNLSPLGRPSSDRPTIPVVALSNTMSDQSSRSFPSQAPSAPASGHVSFLPGDASAFLNQNTSSPMPPDAAASGQGLSPPASSSSVASSAPYYTPGPNNGQVKFLPADASGFLNKQPDSPMGNWIPLTSAPPPVPSSYNAGIAGMAGPAVSSHQVAERGSADATNNHKLDDNPGWFGSGRHSSELRQTAAARASVQSSNYDGAHGEIDEYLAGSMSRPPGDSYGPVHQQSSVESSQAGSMHTNPHELTNQHIYQQDFSQGNVQAVPPGATIARHTPPPITVPNQGLWVPPQARGAPAWPGVDSGSWYAPGSTEYYPSTHGQRDTVYGWPEPPDVDWDRPRVRPRDAI